MPHEEADKRHFAPLKPAAPKPLHQLANVTSAPVVALDEDAAFAQRREIVESITKELQEVGLNITGAGAREYAMILAMSMNALMPEYAGSFLLERNTRLKINASNHIVIGDIPDIQLQQQVVKYFRENPRLREALVACMAISVRVRDPYAPLEEPAVQVRFLGRSNNSGDFLIGDKYFDRVNDKTGVVYIPGCGVSGLYETGNFLKHLKEDDCPNLRFVLCDNNPYVAEVGTRFVRYLGDPRVEFLPLSMEAVAVPNDTTHILLSFVEAAGEKALGAVASQAAAIPGVKVLAISGKGKNEYSALTSEDVAEIFGGCGVPFSWRQSVLSYSTHIVRGGESVDFCDLKADEAHRLIMSELPGGSPPNTESEILTNCRPFSPLAR